MFEFVYWEPVSEFCMDVQHELIASFVLPRIVKNNLRVKREQSGIRNKKHNPSCFFYGFLDKNFLCWNLLFPDFGFSDENAAIIRESCMCAIQIELPEWNWVEQKKTPQSWQEFACSADFFGGCHKIF